MADKSFTRWICAVDSSDLSPDMETPSLATVPPTVATIDIINIHDVYGSDRLSNISRSFTVIIASITIARYTACALA